ncbi:hypothetical protein L3V43_09245 [Pseudoalteromonas sp. L23]|uniref:hypothetical protein n=1 Tax=unclassified Pseudoalteromonas TaxID=194690 RepID=UPI001F229A4C|nr:MULTISPECIES: hypothetical protein [unclassified Pseudoalteromonas]MCF2825743.1 hypothetical protein [Pseudoalteromonas sp. OF5H-5]MCF2831041.1 hypothetical protein [Pseudoalteromonas sp. DL2-H6]MCF2923697.1 hypothetical protein [Pseudoalteromonas sp. DL2-H1]MCF7513801.1 hypothetical protein [Pseudoalteromonas sp. L7]MCF7525841.1 hypothetical protein [Pseudoalteromonas sp. L23]
MTRFRKRFDEDGAESMLSLPVDTGLKSNTIKPSNLREVLVDSTTMEKNVTHSKGCKLLEKYCDKLAGFAKRAERLLKQEKTSKNKLYSQHEPSVEYIAKGKSARPYEFGVKESAATTLKEQFVVYSHMIHSNPYDSDAL